MARDFFQKTFAYRDAADNNALKTANGIQVRVYQPGTTTPVNVFGTRSLADVTPIGMPITTGADGYVEFWADYGDYDIAIHDTIIPVRIADKTFGWNASSGADRGVPSIKVAGDGNILYAALDAMSKRQDVPLGTKIDWWRPSSSYDAGAGAGNPPPGWEPCDGRVIVQANHDFGAIGSITLPDLRNQFILGANIALADAGAGAAANGAANAPGIRGAGGTNVPHSHSVPAHFHSSAATGATIALSAATTGTESADHTHTVSSAGGPPFFAAAGGFDINVVIAGVNASYGTSGRSAAHTHSVSFPHANFSGSIGLVTGGVNGDAAMTSGTADHRPSYVGLLMLMKIRRS